MISVQQKVHIHGICTYDPSGSILGLIISKRFLPTRSWMDSELHFKGYWPNGDDRSMVARVFNFGLFTHMKQDKTHLCTLFAGTFVYIAPRPLGTRLHSLELEINDNMRAIMWMECITRNLSINKEVLISLLNAHDVEGRATPN